MSINEYTCQEFMVAQTMLSGSKEYRRSQHISWTPDEDRLFAQYVMEMRVYPQAIEIPQRSKASISSRKQKIFIRLNKIFYKTEENLIDSILYLNELDSIESDLVRPLVFCDMMLYNVANRFLQQTHVKIAELRCLLSDFRYNVNPQLAERLTGTFKQLTQSQIPYGLIVMYLSENFGVSYAQVVLSIIFGYYEPSISG